MDQKKIITVTGPVSANIIGVTDAHEHVWIDPPVQNDTDQPMLVGMEEIGKDLAKFYQAGGQCLVDCQPGGCGREANHLRILSQQNKVLIVASTGYHLSKYYPPHHWLYAADIDSARDYFIKELMDGVEESDLDSPAIRAGQIKIACSAFPEEWPKHLMTAASQASIATGAAIQVHTERGIGALEILDFFKACQLDPRHLILAHMDKRADFSLHKTLIQEGVLLEYDTFFREKYEPEINVWPLVQKLIENNLSSGIAFANDLAFKHQWVAFGGSPGLASLPNILLPRLASMGFEQTTIENITGVNIINRLARSDNLIN